MIYIQKHIGFYNSQLLGDNYYTGSTWEEYQKGAFILLDEEQLAFHEAYPEATPEEAFHKTKNLISEELPERDQLLQEAYEQINRQVTQDILQNFIWKSIPIWLSQENQFNYKAAYDLAVLQHGKNGTLPVRFKFGTTLDPRYYEFNTLEDFTDFYTSMITFIRNCYQKGWRLKDELVEKTDEELSMSWRKENKV